MDRSQLPQAFLEDMKKILGDQYEDFLASYDQPRRLGLRVNTLKTTPEKFRELVPFHLEKVPWTRNGFTYEESDLASRHAYYSAGLYYLQEPSAMAPAQILPVMPGDRVLDLCAAPGGKATELGARLQGQGLLLANEISAARSRALVRNVELFGIPNACITSLAPAKLAEKLPAFFDKVLVDAPCSGEGMFRKDPEGMKTWSTDKVAECAAVQRTITLQAADMLRPGGYMLYSTCTFAPEENELTVLHILRERPDMELVPVGREDGRESFSAGLSVQALVRLGYLDKEADAPKTDGKIPDLTACARIWPHKADGEGHFIALFRKKELPEAGGPDDGSSSLGRRTDAVNDSAAVRMTAAVNDAAPERSLYAERRTGLVKGKKGRADRQRGKGMGGAGKKAKNGSPEAGEKLSAADRKLILDFISPYFESVEEQSGQDKAAGTAAPSVWSVEKELLRQPDACEVHDGKVYLMAPELGLLSGIPAVRKGLYLGDLKKNRFEPEQELALALPPLPEKVCCGEKKDASGKAEDLKGLYVSLDPADPRIEDYLHGQVIPVLQEGKNGFRLLLAGRYPAGWGKLVAGSLKNKYPAGWRLV